MTDVMRLLAARVRRVPALSTRMICNHKTLCHASSVHNSSWPCHCCRIAKFLPMTLTSIFIAMNLARDISAMRRGKQCRACILLLPINKLGQIHLFVLPSLLRRPRPKRIQMSVKVRIGTKPRRSDIAKAAFRPSNQLLQQRLLFRLGAVHLSLPLFPRYSHLGLGSNGTARCKLHPPSSQPPQTPSFGQLPNEPAR